MCEQKECWLSACSLFVCIFLPTKDKGRWSCYDESFCGDTGVCAHVSHNNLRGTIVVWDKRERERERARERERERKRDQREPETGRERIELN